MTKRRLLMALAVLGAAYLATTLIPDQAGDHGDGRLTMLPCWFAPVSGWGVDCYRLRVPENRANPDNERVLSLPVVVMRSLSGGRDRPPIVHIMGGPGQPAGIVKDDEVQGWASYLSLSPWAVDRDHILYDPRGVGPLADPELRCALLNDLAWSAKLDALGIGTPAWQAAVAEGMAFCRNAFAAGRVDFTAYGTDEAAADLVALRKALKIDRWVPYGVSYGTRPALHLMRIDEAALAAVILDSVSPLHQPAYVEAVPLLSRRLKELFDQCAANAACDAAFPDLPALLDQAVARLEADPVPTVLQDPDNSRTLALTLRAQHFLSVIEYGLVTEGWAATIPLLIANTARGDLGLLEWQAAILAFDPYFQTDANILSYLTQCRDELPINTPEAWAAGRDAAPGLASYDYEDELRFACSLWPTGLAPADFADVVESDVPTLLINGSYDPRTPREWAVDQALTLPNSHVVVVEGAGHAPSVFDSCVHEAMTAFLDDPTDFAPPACLAEPHVPAFMIDMGFEAVTP